MPVDIERAREAANHYDPVAKKYILDLANAVETAEKVMRDAEGWVKEYAESAPNVGLGAYEACERVHKRVSNWLAKYGARK